MTLNAQQAQNFQLFLGMLAQPKLRKEKHLVLLQKYLLAIPIFEKVLLRNGNAAIRDIALNLIVNNYEPDDIIYKLPEDVRTFNYVVSGIVHLYTDTESGLENRYIKKKDLSELSLYKRVYAGEYFGDKVFTTGRKAQIVCAKAIEKTMVISLNLITLHKTFEGIFAFRELEWIIELLRNVAIFSKIPSKKIEQILEHSKRKKYTKGHILFHEGAEAGNLLVILEGEVTLKKKVELPFDQSSIVSRNFDISILSKFDTVGVQEILEDQHYFSTAICESDVVEVLDVEKEIAKQILSPYCLSRILDRNKEIWRKKRVVELESTVSKSTFSPTIQPKQDKQYVSNFIPQFTLQDRKKLSFIEDKSRPSNSRRNIHHRLSLPECKMNHRSITENSTIVPHHRDKSSDFLQQYILKKSKGEKLQIMKYAYSKAADKGGDDVGVVKPLYVRKSQAIKNTMRQIKLSRKHIYSYMLRLTESLP